MNEPLLELVEGFMATGYKGVKLTDVVGLLQRAIDYHVGQPIEVLERRNIIYLIRKADNEDIPTSHD